MPRIARAALPWLAIVLAGTGATWLRLGLIEQPLLADLCTRAAPPWWCPLRQALVLGFLHGVYGWLALAALALALLRRARGLAALAAALGAFALVLYCPESGAFVLLAGCLRLVHLDSGRALPTPAPSPVSARQ
ncbi:MAG: hypothetical protein EPN56_06435 [Rhodanobacter sp.]|nr:MAG: hypothetical protein EPN78_06755 [Rhodanobacter sp.]TAM08464.1 MAG: hypothetical protein EPN66_13235 [Rhodanobacter sp.]TAM36592.1 MAG: hypothetical protein EPN56_06435 [Rhodanobacter sp.]